MTKKFVLDESYIGAELVSRVDLNDLPAEWTKVCINDKWRIDSEVAENQ